MQRVREVPGRSLRMITTSSELAGLLDELPSNGPPYAGIDLEADNLHRYAEQLCLIQISTGTKVVLVDPLEVKDLSPLKEYLNHNGIWMHGADFDMTLLRREFGTLPHMIYDTQIAARLLGILRFSYANLVEQFFEVQLCKASQKENWGQRPLPEKMCEYASNDVRYLLPLADQLEERLRKSERFDWFVESCGAAMRSGKIRGAFVEPANSTGRRSAFFARSGSGGMEKRKNGIGPHLWWCGTNSSRPGAKRSPADRNWSCPVM